VDKKGRVSIPAKLRKDISPDAHNTFIMTPSLDGNQCFDLHPKNLWTQIEERLRGLNKFVPEEARFLRMISQYSDETEMDGQYRIVIPQPLITWAKIEEEALLLGVLDKIEVWNPKIYETYIENYSESFGAMAEKLMQDR
jgi:MraZ protein